MINDGAEKPVSIHAHVGQRPILAAGNTDGDLAMLQWTAGRPHRTLELVINHTDDEREYAYDHDPMVGTGAARVCAAADQPGWLLGDMATDWLTVFVPDVA